MSWPVQGAIGLCPVPDYAELLVKVLARAVEKAVGSA
jgi:hypothetical protein